MHVSDKFNALRRFPSGKSARNIHGMEGRLLRKYIRTSRVFCNKYQADSAKSPVEYVVSLMKRTLPSLLAHRGATKMINSVDTQAEEQIIKQKNRQTEETGENFFTNKLQYIDITHSLFLVI